MGSDKFYKLINTVLEDLDASEKLLKKEPDLIYEKNGIGETVFHYLVVENKLHEVQWLYNKGSKINTTNDFGNTPLSEAASIGNIEVCKFLIEKGADHKVRDEEEGTALSTAAINNKIDVVKLLLELVKSEENLADYFSFIDYDVLLDKESICAKLMSLKGLHWPSEK
jgi:ankyrin repeat protein